MSGWWFLAAAVTFWGAWGFLAKVGQKSGLPSGASMALLGVGYMVVVLMFCMPAIEWREVTPKRMGIVAGLFAGFASAFANIAFYKAMDTVEVSVAVPVSGLYVAVVVILAVAFLGEQLTPTKVAGVVMAIAAAGLLAK